jgi:ankyrin repeat protein
MKIDSNFSSFRETTQLEHMCKDADSSTNGSTLKKRVVVEKAQTKTRVHANIVSSIKNCNKAPASVSKDGPEYLHRAVLENKIDIIYFLLKHGANINQFDKYGKTPLFYAIETNNLSLIKLLLSYKPNLNTVSPIHPITPLELAIDNSQEDIAMLLISHGANIHLQLSNGQSVLASACKRKLVYLVKDLLNRGVNPNTGVDSDTNPLSFAIKLRDTQLIKHLIQLGADINYLFSASQNQSPLFTAVQSRDVHIVKFLLENGGNPNIGATYSHTPMCFAMANNLQEMTTLLQKYSSMCEKIGLWNLGKNKTWKCIVFSFNNNQSKTHPKRSFTNLTGEKIIEINKKGNSWCQPIQVVDQNHIGEKYVHDKLYEVVVIDIGFQSHRDFTSYDFLKKNREKTTLTRVQPGDIVVVPGYFLNDWNNRVNSGTSEVCFWFQPTGILSHSTKLKFVNYGERSRMHRR